MAILELPFNNKNQYRKYPLKQDNSFTSTDGYVVPDYFLVNCSITSVYGKHRVYVRQIFFKAPLAIITIACVATDEVLGAFTGNVTADFTTLNLTPYTKFVSGNLTVGILSSLQAISRVLEFKKGATEFEESLVFCYTPPAVTSIQDKKANKLSGFVNFGVLTNIAKTTSAQTGTTSLQSTSPQSVFNLGDKSSMLGTCGGTVVKTINGVKPFPIGDGSDPINDGNIYIVGVKPLVFYSNPTQSGSPEDGVVNIHSGSVTLGGLCAAKHKMLPPVDVTGFTTVGHIDEYYSKPAMPAYSADPGNIDYNHNYLLPRPARRASNFTETSRPEYYFWPQFAQESYYANFWKPQP
jgi:hypothetical protein